MTAVTSWSATDGDHQFIPISVLDNTIQKGTTHRAPAYVPIQAFYNGFCSSVCISFLQNLGQVEVSITNLYNGEYAEYDIDSSEGTAIIPISGNYGLFRITFELSEGSGYTGEFEIES